MEFTPQQARDTMTPAVVDRFETCLAGDCAGVEDPATREAVMFDDRVCPACQVLLPTGATRCVKCGRAVAPPRSPLAFLEWPTRVYPWLSARLGPAWGGVAAVLLFLLLFALTVLVAGLLAVLGDRR